MKILNNKPIETVGILVMNNDQVLLVEHREGAKHLTGIYGIPGGKIQPNETMAEAAVRELKEETGLVTTVNDLELLPAVYERKLEQKEGLRSFRFHVYLCRNYRGNLLESDETTPVWILIDKLHELPLLGNVHEIVTTIGGKNHGS